MRFFARRLAGLMLALALSFVLLTLPASAAPARVYHQGTFFEYTTLCTGEQVELRGTYTTVYRQNADGTRTSTSQVHAVGSGSNGRYVFVMSRRATWNASGGIELSGTAHQLLVSQGDQPDERVWFSWDFTVSPPIFDLEPRCSG